MIWSFTWAKIFQDLNNCILGNIASVIIKAPLGSYGFLLQGSLSMTLFKINIFQELHCVPECSRSLHMVYIQLNFMDFSY